MNEPSPEHIILTQAAAAVQKSTGVRVTAKQQKNRAFDRRLTIKTPKNNVQNLEFDFSAEIRKTLTQAALGEILIRARRATQKPLLVAEYIAPAEADRLRELDLAFFDAAGNAYFNEPGLYVFVNTKRNIGSDEQQRRAQKNNRSFEQHEQLVLRPAELKTVFALLTNSRLESADYRTIAEESNVALGGIGWLMSRLRATGFLIDDSQSKRKLVKKPELLKVWVEGYLERLRPKQILARFEATAASGRWWEAVDLEKEKAVWGGEIGGQILTRHLKPQTVTIYADSVLPRLQARYGLRRRADGDVEILRKFWKDQPSDKSVAPPLVVYADLLASRDERNLETAARIYDRYLARFGGQTA